MIYFDNAATTKQKPQEVYDAFLHYVQDIGVSPGRGSYQLGIEASRMLYQTRKVVSEYFGLIRNSGVIFTKNSTEAINLFFRGFLCEGNHVVITCYEHNAVLRPLQTMKEEGIIDFSIISRDDLLLSPIEICDKYFRDNTVLLVNTLASNLTGRIIYNSELIKEAKRRGVQSFVDSSQGAGKIQINMSEGQIDYLAFTGHKDLMALPGVGGLCCLEKPKWKPLLQGGTGVLGDSYTNPKVFPEGYEAGTLNMPAIWSLHASLTKMLDCRNLIYQKEQELKDYMMKKLSEDERIVLYDSEFDRIGTFGINLCGIKSNDLVKYLDENEICVRGGIHCAILAHEALGTVKDGVVRVSLGLFNTKEEIDTFSNILKGCK
ncbi:MAG: aminotransferase class V-fold PLP-dependent enzyme [Paludibacteraceae bacterium]|nr:aminotransferase class V-fold PLP-dependent enzyme [Paludibacteraceae bacterium]